MLASGDYGSWPNLVWSVVASVTVLAAYDIRENDRRARVAAVLQTVGDRVQKSVFVLLVDPADLDELTQRVTELIDTNTDSFLMFRQCEHCWKQAVTVGQASTPQRVTHWGIW
ncbi:MAG: CRISPR-associated endonuclease Cas2 [Propioniciclava sp.]